MANTWYVTTETRQQVRELLAMEGDDQAVTVDYSPWVEDNGTVTSVTWTVESGQASIDGQNLASNVATARITTSEAGRAMVKVSATDGTHTKNIYIKVMTKDPDVISFYSDYGFVA